MRNKLWITVGVLAGLMLMGYLLALLSTSPGDTSAVESSGPRERSWLGDMIHAWKVTRPKDDGIRRVKSIYPDSDTSECQWYKLSADQMITTRFAGHILRYPCTANHDGHTSIHYNHADEVIYQNHALYVRVLIRPDRKSIWRQSPNEHGTKKDAFKVQLRSAGQKISNEPIREWISGATRIAEFESTDISVYLNGNDIKGFISDQMNDRGGYPNVGCTGSTVERALSLFDPNLPLHEGSSCSISWNLNDHIKAHVLMFDSTLARDFEFFYRKIDQGLKEIIVSTPGETSSAN